MWGVLTKMLEGKMRYFLHDCRMFDTYELATFIRNCHLVYKRNYQEILMWCRVIKNIKRLNCYLLAFLVLDTPVAARRQGKTANDIARRKLITSLVESNMRESNIWITFLKCSHRITFYSNWMLLQIYINNKRVERQVLSESINTFSRCVALCEESGHKT